MQRFIILCSAVAVLEILPVNTVHADSVVYDLKTDWSDTQNPNGAWAYLEPEGALLSDDPFPWVGSSGVVLARTTAGSAGLEVGDVYGVCDLSGRGPQVRWTAPADGSVDLSGAIWNTTTDQDVFWKIRVNDISGGGRSILSSPSAPTQFSSGAWFRSDVEPIDGGLNIPIEAGDQVLLSFEDTGGLGFYPIGNPFGINFTVTFRPGSGEGSNESPDATILAPPSGYLAAVGEEVSLAGSIVDDDEAGTHTAEWMISSSTMPDFSIPGTVYADSVSDAVQFLEAGVYSIKLIVTDVHGASGTATTVLNDLPAYVVVYDPEGNFVTGGGWIASPWGAYYPGEEDLAQLGGWASFGFVSKYKNGASVPTGQTEFHYHLQYLTVENTGSMTFESSSYEWLVVSGARAQFKGNGTINGEGNFGFIVTATDSQVTGGGDVDRFRIKIWDIATEVVVYDNQAGFDDDAELNDFNYVRGGNILIHNK